jgi:16S rRNA (uracil1498-N3)-methyltransferase
MQLFYCKDITPEGYATLDAEESRHAVRVLRLREGDIMHVTDGQGHLYECRVVEASDKACTVETQRAAYQMPMSLEETQHAASLHLAVAPTKNPSRMEWLVEKAVEVGVGEITLLDCDHSERSFLKTDRLERLALSAMKQSLHLTLPRIHPAVKLREWLRTFAIGTPELRFIAHCEANQPRTPLASALEAGRDAVVLIGPEGDFSQEEIDLALECGFRPVSLGPSRLRTETAALYAAVAFSVANEESRMKN